jgi:hypothetical protein
MVIARITSMLLAFAAAAVVLLACSNDTTSNKGNLDGDTTRTAAERDLEKLFYSLPSPGQVLYLLKQAGAKYDKALLNPTTKAASYQSSTQAALNLGIYSADLAFASTYDQTQDAVTYFVTIQKLAEQLGIGDIFDQNLALRIERNKANQDSIIRIASDAFQRANRKLKANDQGDAAGLILVGGWVEGLHLATGIYNLSPKPGIAERIAEQKLAYENVLAILEQTGATTKPDAVQVMVELKTLGEAFAPITFDYDYTGAKTDSTRRVTVIDNKSKANYTDAQLKAISDAVHKLRAAIVN